MMAAKKEHTEIVRFLVESAGADFNGRDMVIFTYWKRMYKEEEY